MRIVLTLFLYLLLSLNTNGQTKNTIGEEIIADLSTKLRNEIINSDFLNAKKTLTTIDSIYDLAKDDRIKGLTAKLKGAYYYNTSDYENAMQYWLEAANCFEKTKDSIDASKTYNNISLILNTSKQYKKSLQLKKKALALCPPDKFDIWRIVLLNNIGSTNRDLDNIDSSFFYINKAYKLAKNINSKENLGVSHFQYSLNYYKQKDFEKGIKHFDTIEAEFKNTLAPSTYENSVFYTATALNEIGRYREALRLANKSVDMVLRNGFIINAADSYELRSKIYANLGNKNKALEELKKSNIYRDSIFNLEKNKAVLELEKKYETEKKEKENLQLKQETAKKDLTIAKKNNYLLFGSLIFVSIIMALVFYQLRKFRKKNADLKKSIERREKLKKELEVVRDNIAKDFHDDLGNKLARITTLSDLMITTSHKRDKSNIIEALGQIKQDSDVLYSGTRDFMFSLKAKSDYVEELFTYLSDFGEDYFQSFKIDFLVTKTVEVNKKLPYYWNRQIIMIFKEAMTNTVKYAQASEAKLDLQFVKDNLVVKFIDNGKGFDTNALKRKNGLTNMQTRAKKINGDLNIDTNESGTKIEFNAQLSESKYHV